MSSSNDMEFDLTESEINELLASDNGDTVRSFNDDNDDGMSYVNDEATVNLNDSGITYNDSDDDEIQLLCVKKGSKSVPGENFSVCYKEKNGYVQEMFSDNVGILFSMESGPVVFNRHCVWIHGQRFDPNSDEDEIWPGLRVTFIEVTIEDPEYSIVSSDCVMKQALAVWTGNRRPQQVLRFASDQSHRDEMALDRKDFINRFRHNDFLSVDMVRAVGHVKGYLTATIGLIEVKDFRGRQAIVLFHSSDVYIFRKRLEDQYREPAYDVLNVGVTVNVDARKMSSPLGVVTYQACAVFAGFWPTIPHPTLLPGGPGSFAPSYDVPHGSTFYYLNPSMRRDLRSKRTEFEDGFYDYVHRLSTLESKFLQKGLIIMDETDAMLWRDGHAPHNLHGRTRGRRGIKKNYHIFAKDTPTGGPERKKPFEPKPELKDEVEI